LAGFLTWCLPLHMINLHFKLFARLIWQNREIYLLKIVTLAVAFAAAILIALFALQEFEYDTFHKNSAQVFRMLQKNTDEAYRRNRFSCKIPSGIFEQLESKRFNDSLIVTRVKSMKEVTVVANNLARHDQKVHACDPTIISVFSFDVLSGSTAQFNSSSGPVAMLSERAAVQYFGSSSSAGKVLGLYTYGDTVELRIVAVFKDFPQNSHDDFDVLVAFDPKIIAHLNFNPDDFGVYGRVTCGQAEDFRPAFNQEASKSKFAYSLQAVPDIYFGPRVRGEEARHGDRYSVLILISLTCLILFLSLATFINLTTITLPHRAKELAIKKLAGTKHINLLIGFLKESSSLVGVSLFLGLLILVTTSGWIHSFLEFNIREVFTDFNPRFISILFLLFTILSSCPLVLTLRFVKASPNRLLSTDAITFPKLKRAVTFFQLGISVFLIVASVVVGRQINHSLVKEPGQNHDQVVFLNSPSGITNEGILDLRDGWRKFNPNILDVMAVSQLPDRVISKEIGSEFYILQADRGFRGFFNLRMEKGFWFGANNGDSMIVVNASGERILNETQTANVIGVIEDMNGEFNRPEKPTKIKIAEDYNYNWLCVRVIEVDIRRTVNRLSELFSTREKIAHVNYLDSNFKRWIDYQDRMNALSGILAILSAVLSAFAIYGLSVSIVREKVKHIAVHKLFGAGTAQITYLLVREFGRQVVTAIMVFGPITYILLNELLRTFAYSTKFSWLDPVYPIVYCSVVIFAICGFQARSLNKINLGTVLKN
jgi:putative ABC transport system permease protein